MNEPKSLYHHLYISQRIKPDFPLTVVFPNKMKCQYFLHSQILKEHKYFKEHFDFNQGNSNQLEPLAKKVKRENILEIPPPKFNVFRSDFSEYKDTWENHIIPYLYNHKDQEHYNSFNLFNQELSKNLERILSIKACIQILKCLGFEEKEQTLTLRYHQDLQPIMKPLKLEGYEINTN